MSCQPRLKLDSLLEFICCICWNLEDILTETFKMMHKGILIPLHLIFPLTFFHIILNLPGLDRVHVKNMFPRVGVARIRYHCLKIRARPFTAKIR